MPNKHNNINNQLRYPKRASLLHIYRRRGCSIKHSTGLKGCYFDFVKVDLTREFMQIVVFSHIPQSHAVHTSCTNITVFSSHRTHVNDRYGCKICIKVYFNECFERIMCVEIDSIYAFVIWIILMWNCFCCNLNFLLVWANMIFLNSIQLRTIINSPHEHICKIIFNCFIEYMDLKYVFKHMLFELF